MNHGKLDLFLGYAATAFGASGAAMQWWGQLGNLLLIAINLVLALGGIWVIALRIRKARLELQDIEQRRKG